MTGILRAGSIGNRNAGKKLPEQALTLAQHFDLMADVGGGFATEADRRAAWAEHGAEIMAAFFARPQHPTVRPEAWWQYTEGIPPRLRRLPDWPEDAEAPWEVEEPIKLARARWLARHGHLSADEIADLEADTAEDSRQLRAAVRRGLGGAEKSQRETAHDPGCHASVDCQVTKSRLGPPGIPEILAGEAP